MRILTVVGARPQFVKAAAISAELRVRGIEEILVHTGQHYDTQMSDVFFAELPLPQPAHSLRVGSGDHGAQTGEIMKRLERVVKSEAPDCVVVYGDTNSTLAGALVAAKLHVPLAHVEAGLRSFNRAMPEEVNRVVADHVSDTLFAPTENARKQLMRESVPGSIHVVGDLMVDLARAAQHRIEKEAAVLRTFGLTPKSYGIVTIHRAANTDDDARFAAIMKGVSLAKIPLLFPAHPRLKRVLGRIGTPRNVITCAPLSYGDFLVLQHHAKVILTDSGGIQKEAFVARVPCVTLRDETEWTETLEDGWNILAGSDPERIAAAANRPVPSQQHSPYGDGRTAQRIVDVLSAAPVPSAASTLKNAV